MNAWKIAAWVVASSCAACHVSSGAMYVAPSAQINGTRGEIMPAAERFAQAQGWRVIHASRNHGVVEALTPTVDEGGVALRERWFLFVEDAELRVQRVLEVRFDPQDEAGWESTAVVCDTYKYEAEHALLAGFHRFLAKQGTTRPQVTLSARAN